MPEHVYRKARTCDICDLDLDHGWWCRNCGTRFCDVCSKGGRSSSMGVAVRIIAGVVTYGVSEIVRYGYRKANQKCPNCEETDLIRI
jgi:hypothetical protein